MTAVIKTTIKLLLRNKGFLFFLLITPIISTLILSSKTDHTVYHQNQEAQISELKDLTERAVYAADANRFIIKVYDSAETALSEYLLRELVKNGLFSVCRVDVRGISDEDILAQIKKDGFDDRAGVILHLKADFDNAVSADRFQDGLELFRISDDEREALFTSQLDLILEKIYRAASFCGSNEQTLDFLSKLADNTPQKSVVFIANADQLNLTDEEQNCLTQIGYAFAIITLGFLFCGVFAAHTIIIESGNRVYTRMMLTDLSAAHYFLSKFVVVILMCLLQTGVLALCLSTVNGLDVGMPMPVFLFSIFLLGIIFATFSMLTGIVFRDIMSTNYAAFVVWSLSAMLAGLLFPIGDASELLKKLSYLMPQKYFMDITEKALAGLSGGIPLMLCVTAAYLIIMLSVGSVVLKVKKPAE